ncbi:hypothetical protein KFE25_013402 [Diacronema lutheri]|uniref:SNARE associated Golgi protein n=1 Tax=Diacronema lutheri TaxID=2081491 RepID=A0A7R9YNC6_DIALT|nr:hypothetical protein KFE25_013402 [Diacronema lutheri]|mmetsp:Transcript_6383/g.20070  ORF Transcript_6383/g.20070 Transcript_6383/m.20070 type:complete len:250 (+) Transcript_6383:685-1434(+)
MLLDAALRVFVFLQTQGRLGAVYYSAFLTAWTLCCLPTTPLEVAAGYTFTPALSIGASIVGKTTGSLVAFALGRALANRFSGGRRVVASANAPATPRGALGRARAVLAHLQTALVSHPVQTIGMIRASPMPIALKNYGLAALPEHVVPSRTFCLVTVVVNVPYSVAWSLAGSSASSLQDAISGKARSGGGTVALKVGALLALFAALTAFASRCQAELRRLQARGRAPGRSKRDGAPSPAQPDGAKVKGS